MTRERRIIGPPGCGKSTRLAAICREAIVEHGTEGVVICSLTRSAAAAIAEKTVGAEALSLPRRNVGTLHALAYHALSEPEIADSQKALKVWNEWISGEKQWPFRVTVEGGNVDDAATEQYSGETTGDRAYGEVKINRARCLPEGALSGDARIFQQYWRQFKSDCDLMDFGDLLDTCFECLDTIPGNPGCFLLDEGQDFSRQGWRLARKWGERCEQFICAADPAQNLYYWAGSDTRAFLEPAVPVDQIEVLNQSYRVPGAVQRFALRVIEPHLREIEALLGKEIIYDPRRSGDGKVVEGRVRRCNSEWKFPDGAITLAERYIESGKSVMFLASCSYMLQPLLACLRKRGLPFWNRYRRSRSDWNPLTPARGISASQRLLAFLRPSPEAWGEKAEMWSARELWSWIEWVEAKGLLRHGAKETLKLLAAPLQGTLPVESSTLQDLFENFEAVIDALELIGDGRGCAWLRQRLLSSRQRTMEFPMTVAEKRGTAALTETPMIQAGTIHSVKGGEDAVVFLWPDLSSAGYQNYRGEREEYNGVLRAFYVACTRAREELVICRQGSPLAIKLPAVE